MKLKFSDVLFKGAIEYNPTLIQCVGLCPIILASTSLKDSFLMSAVIIVDLLVTSLIASALLKNVARYIRVALYLVIGLALIVPILWFIENKTLMNMTLGMRVFIPLIAVNSITAVHCEQFAVKNDVRIAVYDSLAAGIGASIVMIICGAMREVMGSGSILGYDLGLSFKLSGMAMPYGCLIILGFMAAILKTVFSSEKKKVKKPVENIQPEEVTLNIENELEPESVDLDLSIEENDDEYAYLLASVNELIDSFSKKEKNDEGGREE